MRYRTFTIFNIVGGVLWGSGVTTLGYLLGQVGFVRTHIELILIAVVVVSLLPVVAGLLRSRRRLR